MPGKVLRCGEVLTYLLIAKLCLTSIRAFCYESSDIDVCGATGLSQWRAWTGSNLFASVFNQEITMKTLILAAIRCSLMFLVTGSLFSARPAQAYMVTLEQMGANVVATGSGAINLTGLTLSFPGAISFVQVFASLGTIETGALGVPNDFVDGYTGF